MLDKPSYEYVNEKVQAVKDKVGDTATLQTTEKTSVVKAVNELFTSVSNGKSKVASAITDKGVSTAQDATFDQMATNIRSIQTGSTGITPSGTKQITDNGTYDVTAFASAEVNVPKGIEVSGTKSITSNGEHDVSTYAKANVNVPIPSGYIKPSGTKAITENGTHDVTNYASVTVSVEGSVAVTDGKIIAVNLSSDRSTAGWYTLVSADTDIQAHKDDQTLVVTVHCMTAHSSGKGCIPFAIVAASQISNDGKSSFFMYQNSSGAGAVTSTTRLLRTKSTARGAIYVNDNGGIEFCVDSSSYPLRAGKYIVSVSW